MTAKEYLMQARRLQARIEQLQSAQASAWERATATTQSGSMPVMGGEISRKTESYAELSATIADEYDRLNRVRADIVKTIGKVNDNTLAALLISYYINGNTWEQTAVAIHYSYFRTVHDKHPQALRAVQEVIDCYTHTVI